MAEFENGYCTGCGYKVKRWGHRPYCWRMVCHYVAQVDTNGERIERCLQQMGKHHRFLSLFLAKKKHMYYYPPGTRSKEWGIEGFVFFSWGRFWKGVYIHLPKRTHRFYWAQGRFAHDTYGERE